VLRISSRRRNRQSSGLSNAVSEALAAWILAFLVFGAGLSLLAFHERGLRAGVVVPEWRAPPVAAKEQWDDPECRRDIMLCSDLPAEGNSADPVRVPSQSAMGM
jgi:hypothetical protein